MTDITEHDALATDHKPADAEIQRELKNAHQRYEERFIALQKSQDMLKCAELSNKAAEWSFKHAEKMYQGWLCLARINDGKES